MDEEMIDMYFLSKRLMSLMLEISFRRASASQSCISDLECHGSGWEEQNKPAREDIMLKRHVDM